MKTLMTASDKTLEKKTLSGKGWRLLLALVLVVASLLVVAPAQIARADAGGQKGHLFDFTFTKWATKLPEHSPSLAGVPMAGVVGGDIGNGTFAGLVISDDVAHAPLWYATARYEFYTPSHFFIATVNVVQNNSTGSGTITGLITDGWLKGSQLTGDYVVTNCAPGSTPGNVFGTRCFVGTLHVLRGRGFLK